MYSAKTFFSPSPLFGAFAKEYAQSRPGYPKEILAVLSTKYGFNKSWLVADIGAGTGLSSKLFLDNGNTTFSVEPDLAMLEQGQGLTEKFEGILSRAENTGFRNQVIDLIVVATAFHWFDLESTKQEFHRILAPNGVVSIFINLRDNTGDDFTSAYESLLLSHSQRYKTLFGDNAHENAIRELFSESVCEIETFANPQVWDKETLINRTRSAAWFSEPLLIDALDLFEKYQQNNQVIMKYETYLYHGHLSPVPCPTFDR